MCTDLFTDHRVKNFPCFGRQVDNLFLMFIPYDDEADSVNHFFNFKCIVACSMNSKHLVKIQIACFTDTTNFGLQCMMATSDEFYKKIVSVFMIYFQDRKEFEKLLTDTFSPF